jgi:hypothetical protein
MEDCLQQAREGSNLAVHSNSRHPQHPIAWTRMKTINHQRQRHLPALLSLNPYSQQLDSHLQQPLLRTCLESRSKNHEYHAWRLRNLFELDLERQSKLTTSSPLEGKRQSRSTVFRFPKTMTSHSDHHSVYLHLLPVENYVYPTAQLARQLRTVLINASTVVISIIYSLQTRCRCRDHRV